MNLLVFSQYYPRSGSHSGIFIHNQNINLIKLGIDVTVLAPTPWSPRVLWFKKRWKQYGRLTDRATLDGVRVFYVKYPFLVPAKAFYRVNAVSLYLWTYRFIKKNLANRKFDLILARPLIPTGYSACLLAKRMKLPVVCEGSGSDVKIYPYYNRTSLNMYSRVLKDADQIIANAKNLAEDINANAGNGICEVVYRGVNIKKFRPLKKRTEARRVLGIEEDTRLLLFVGNLSPEKGIYDLLAAFKATLTEFSHVQLYLIGQSYMDRDIIQFMEAQNLGKKICYVGPKPQAELPLWYNACDFLVLPSYSEGMPNVVFEAMACARPVVATPVGGVPEVVVNNRTGLLVGIGEIDQLSNAMLRLLTEDRLAETLGKKAFTRIRENFVDTLNAKKLVKLLGKLLVEKRKFLSSEGVVK